MSNNDLFEHHSFIIDPNQSLIRIDRFLTNKISNATRTKIQDAIEQNYIEVNGNSSIKSNYKVKPGDIIKMHLPEPPKETEVIPENIALDIVYEDAQLLIVNKPPNMVVHPAYNNWTGTLVNGLAYHFQNLPNKKGNIGRPGLVHRIDKDTTGLLVIAKTEYSMSHLSKQFSDHTIERKYLALVWGNIEEETGTIDSYLTKHPKDRKIVISIPLENISTNPSIELEKDVQQLSYPKSSYSRIINLKTLKRAITHFKVLKRYMYCTLIECSLETGRTHQIRAHMQSIGNPIFGDIVYGGDKICKGPAFSKYKAFIQNCFKLMPYQALHAKYIKFIHPETNELIEFDSQVPENFNNVLKKWDTYLLQIQC